MVRSGSRQFDTWTTIWLALAALWSLGLVAAGFLVNSYSVTSSTGQTPINEPGQTLVQVNGLKVLYVLSVPFVAVVIVAFALRRRRRSQRPGVGVFVWIVVGLLVVLVVLGAFTIGPFIAPVAVFVALAIAQMKDRSLSQDY